MKGTMKGKLQAISIQSYGLFDKKKALIKFEVKNKKIRKELDSLQGSTVSLKEIKKIIEKINNKK